MIGKVALQTYLLALKHDDWLGGHTDPVRANAATSFGYIADLLGDLMGACVHFVQQACALAT